MSNMFQLFKKKPEDDFVFKLLKLYGLESLDQNYRFSLEDLEKRNTIEGINNIKDELKEYYINCKFEKYVSNLNAKKCITILRHFLKLINYVLVSHEKYSKGKKFLLYNILNNSTPSADDYNFTINFD